MYNNTFTGEDFMKSCIYKIVFQDGTTYVGQTQDYNRRIKEHLSTRGKGSPKLAKAFQQDPEPAFYIVEETTDLDLREVYWIDVLKPELNVLPGGDGMRGLNHPRAKYTRQQILDVVQLWCTTALPVTDISRSTGVEEGTCHDIIKKRSHLWSTDGVDMMVYDRKRTYKIYDPLGNLYTGTTIREVSEKSGLATSAVSSLMNSKRGVNLQGWSVTPPQVVILVDPEQNKTTTTIPLAVTTLRDNGLSKFQVDQLTKRFKPSAGWKITLCPQKGIDFL
jgi:hypothetical protein